MSWLKLPVPGGQQFAVQRGVFLFEHLKEVKRDRGRGDHCAAKNTTFGEGRNEEGVFNFERFELGHVASDELKAAQKRGYNRATDTRAERDRNVNADWKRLLTQDAVELAGGDVPEDDCGVATAAREYQSVG